MSIVTQRPLTLLGNSLEPRPIPPFHNWEGRKRVWQHTASFSVPLPGEWGANQIAERYINALVTQRNLARYRSLFSSCLKRSNPATVELPQAQLFSIADDDMILHLRLRRRAVNPSHCGYAFLVVAYAFLVDYSAPLTQKTVRCVARPFSAPPNYEMAEWVWVRDYSINGCSEAGGVEPGGVGQVLGLRNTSTSIIFFFFRT